MKQIKERGKDTLTTLHVLGSGEAYWLHMYDRNGTKGGADLAQEREAHALVVTGFKARNSRLRRVRALGQLFLRPPAI